MKKYDVIIVGCGPAGIGAAKILEKNNINYCIIEKNKFPREKLCGGGLTNKSINILKELELNIKDIKTIDAKEIELVTKDIKKTIKLDNKIVMTERKEFDNNNFKQVKNIYQEETIQNIEDNILITDKNKYEFKYIIFADGVNGYSRKLITYRKLGFCVECLSKTKTNKTVLDFKIVKNGYGWIFPKKDHITIGLGNIHNEIKEDYVNLLIKFAKEYNIEIDKDKIRGYFIPMYSKKVYKNSVIDNKYILVGDTATLVDPVSGEGIYYALASGKNAAESIIECLKNNEELKNIYFKKSNNMYKELNKRLFLSKLLYSKLKFFYIKIGLSNKKFINKLNKLFG